MVKRLIFLTLLILMSSNIALAADDAVSITMEPAAGSIYDTFRMTVTVDWERSGGKIELLENDNFEVVGQGKDVNVSVADGQISQEISHKFILKPLKEGLLEGPGVRIWPRKGQHKDYPGKSVRIKKGPVQEGTLSQDLNFRQSVDKLEVYQGQQFLNTIEIISRISLDNLLVENPVYNNAWVEQLEHNNIRSRVDSQGNHFKVHSISNVLYPTRPGTLRLPRRSFRADALIPRQARRARSLYDDPFGGTLSLDDFGMFGGRYQRQPVMMNSNEMEVEVLPLPDPPADFPDWNLSQPVVGKTNISVSYDDRPVKVGESRTLFYTIESEGNIAPIKSVPFPDLKNVKLYEESPELLKELAADTLIMKLKIPVTVVPLTAGNITVPPVSLGYFDPETGNYVIAKTASATFSVTGTSVASVTPGIEELPAVAPSAEEEQEKPQSTPSPPVYEEPTALELAMEKISPVTLIFGFGIVLVLTAMSLLIFWYLRATGGKRSLRSRLRRADTPDELRSAFLELASGYTGSRPTDADALKQQLEKTVLPADVKFELLTIYDELNYLCFSGSPTTGKLGEVRQKIAGLTQRL